MRTKIEFITEQKVCFVLVLVRMMYSSCPKKVLAVLVPVRMMYSSCSKEEILLCK